MQALSKAFPNKYYQSLAGDTLDTDVDSVLIDNKGGTLYGKWHNGLNPSRFCTEELGAGQYRAVGRVVTMSRYEDIGKKLTPL